jgi:hypothetical protein
MGEKRAQTESSAGETGRFSAAPAPGDHNSECRLSAVRARLPRGFVAGGAGCGAQEPPNALPRATLGKFGRNVGRSFYFLPSPFDHDHENDF